MSPSEIRIAIAEACPHILRRIEHGFWEYFDSRERQWTGCRNNDPVNDLNAMHEAEKTLMELGLYTEHLERICRNQSALKFASPGVWSVHATAAQRAEAFLRTIGKWKEAA